MLTIDHEVWLNMFFMPTPPENEHFDPKKGTISIGNTSEPTIDFLQGHSFVFLGVTPVFEKENKPNVASRRRLKQIQETQTPNKRRLKYLQSLETFVVFCWCVFCIIQKDQKTTNSM